MVLQELYIGQKAEYSKVITKEMVETFSEISGDINPLHLDDNYAKNTIFKGRIAHGILVSGLISAVIANKLPGEGSIYLTQSLKFIKPVRLNDKITAAVEIISIDDENSKITLSTICRNAEGKIVIDGEAQVLVDKKR